MKIQELERRLLAPAAAEKLAQQAKALRAECKQTDTDQPSRRLRPIGDSVWALQASAEAIKDTDLKRLPRPAILADLGAYLPEVKDDNPVSTLSYLINRLTENPTEENQFLLSDAINRLTLGGELDATTDKVVKEAINCLIKLPGGDPDTTGAVFANLYQHADFRGRSIFAFLGVDSIYHSIRGQHLKNVGMHDAISSLTLNTTTNQGRGDIILFEHDRFFGKFTSLRTDASPGTQGASLPYLGNRMNDKTSSILMVRRFEGEQIRALGDSLTKNVIANIIGGIDQVDHLRGDPVFTWDMWPTGGDDHPNAPNKRLIQIKIPIEVEVPNWFNYDAEIRLWFYLYVSQGQVKGYLSHYGAWVEGGIISGSVLDGIMEVLPTKFGVINDNLNTVLALLNANGPYRHVYLLPGDQTLFTGSRYHGHTEDNVSIVLVPESIPFSFEYEVKEIFM